MLYNNWFHPGRCGISTSIPAYGDSGRSQTKTVRIIESSSRPEFNLRKTDRAALKTLKKNRKLTILPADKGNPTVVLNTLDYKHRTSSLQEDPIYGILAKDPTDAIE